MCVVCVCFVRISLGLDVGLDEPLACLGDEANRLVFRHPAVALDALAKRFPLDKFPAYKEWYERLMARPVVKAGVKIPGPLPDMSSYVQARKEFALPV